MAKIRREEHARTTRKHMGSNQRNIYMGRNVHRRNNRNNNELN